MAKSEIQKRAELALEAMRGCMKCIGDPSPHCPWCMKHLDDGKCYDCELERSIVDLWTGVLKRGLAHFLEALRDVYDLEETKPDDYEVYWFPKSEKLDEFMNKYYIDLFDDEYIQVLMDKLKKSDPVKEEEKKPEPVKEPEPAKKEEKRKTKPKKEPESESETINCSQCDKKEIPTTEAFYCRDCDFTMCGDCLKKHSRENPKCFPVLASQRNGARTGKSRAKQRIKELG